MMIFALLLPCFAASHVHAQIKKQLFTGAGISASRYGGPKNVTSVGGFALLIPVSKAWVLRPLIAAGGTMRLSDHARTPTLQMACLFGRKLTPRATLMGGGGMQAAFPAHSPATRLPSANASFSFRFNRHWGVIAPLSVTSRGAGMQLQASYIW